MKKFILIISMIFIGTLPIYAQSNTKGTIHLGINAGCQLGIAFIQTTGHTYSYFSSALSSNAKPSTAVKVSLGIAKRFSAGLYARKEISSYPYAKYNGIAVGLEGKYYLVNKDKFNLYAGPTIGYSTGNISNHYGYDDNFTAGVTGYNYSIGAGMNWYWTKFLGMSVDVGYGGTFLSGHIDHKVDIFDNGYPDTFDIKIRHFGIYAAVGIVTKFGGKK